MTSTNELYTAYDLACDEVEYPTHSLVSGKASVIFTVFTDFVRIDRYVGIEIMFSGSATVDEARDYYRQMLRLGFKKG